jgi:hypothetical protein
MQETGEIVIETEISEPDAIDRFPEIVLLEAA